MNKYVVSLLGSAGLLGGVSSVMADVPVEASGAVTTLITDAGTFIGSLWPLLIAVTVGFLYMKLFVKGANKAT